MDNLTNVKDYNGNELVVVCIIFLVLTLISVLLRCFVRIQITRAFSADDWFMLLAQVSANCTYSSNKSSYIPR
jgi:hypothetical protein